MGASNTIRTLGGCVALAVCSTVLHADLKRTLGNFLTPEQASAVVRSSAAIENLSDSDALKVRQAYGASYDAQYRALLAFAGLGFAAGLCLGMMTNRLRDRLEAVVKGGGQEK